MSLRQRYNSLYFLLVAYHFYRITLNIQKCVSGNPKITYFVLKRRQNEEMIKWKKGSFSFSSKAYFFGLFNQQFYEAVKFSYTIHDSSTWREVLSIHFKSTLISSLINKHSSSSQHDRVKEIENDVKKWRKKEAEKGKLNLL